MNFRPKLFVSALLLCSGAALSANENSYYNVVGVAATPTLWMPGMPQMVYDVYLTQDAVTCTDPDWSMKVGTSTYRPSGYGGIAAGGSTGVCYGSAEATPENLYDLVKKYWVDAVNTSNLTLGSDIDLGEMSATDGECKANHKPLPYKSGKTFYGENHKISNLCYVSSTMSESVGFFDAVENTLMQDVVLDGVQIVVRGTVGERVYPVGSLAGSLNLVTLENVKLSNVSIDAPLAGGVAGVVLNSSIIKMSNSGNISISNTQAVTTPPKKVAVGETDYGLVGPYGVLLGGVAGISIRDDRNDTAFTLDDVSLSVRIQNAAEGTRSALGGAIGFVFSSQDKFRNVNVVTGGVAKSASTSRISGGSAMGGLVGYTSLLYQNNSPIAVDKSVLKLERSSFAGEIGDASSPDVIAVGGLVGRDSLLAFTKLEIVNSTANISFTDEVKKTGSYRYYAGGILGYGNNCPSSNRATDFLVIEKTKSFGSMSLTASDKSVAGLHVDAFMGGIVGSACIAMENRAFKDDSSSVSITSKVKTTGDSVSIGGAAGSVFVSDAKGISFTNLFYTGNIVVEDSLGELFVGGVLGQFREAEGGKTVVFKDVYVKTEGNLIDYRFLAPSKPADTKAKGARIGGLCGFCKESSLIEKVEIIGGISVDAGNNYAGDSLFVGGLLGSIYNASVGMTLQKTRMVGDISVDASAMRTTVGYLVGFGVMPLKNIPYVFRSNYHYAENENVDAFGFLSETDAYSEGIAAVWMDHPNMTYNVRNGLNSTYESNDLHNGFALASEMKTRNFAGELNSVFSDIDNESYAWCYETGSADKLPFVTMKNVTAVSPGNEITYTVSFFDYDGKSLLQTPEKVPEGKSAQAPEEPTREGYIFVGWDKAFDNVTSDLSILPVYEIIRYWVQFCTEDGDCVFGTDSEESTYPHGSVVEEPDMDLYGDLFVKEGYTFVGWDDETHRVGVTQDLKIYPKYKANDYTLFLVDDENRVITSGSVSFGTEIVLPETADKPETDEYIYTFEKWTMEDNSPVPQTMPAGNLTVVAEFKAERKKYKVTFLDYDGEVLDSQMVEYGSGAQFPAYEDSEDKVLFAWSDSALAEITGTKTVNALVKFKITFKMTEDSVFHEEWIAYDAPIGYVNEMVLDRQPSDGYVYTFVRWDPEIQTVTGPAVYTAVYETQYVGDLSSSSSEPASSSSSVIVVANDMIEKSSLKTSGHAVRLTYSTQKIDPAVRTLVRLAVDGANGFAVDTVLVDSLSSSSGTGSWESIAVPDGDVVVRLYVQNEFATDSAVHAVAIKAEKDVDAWDWKMVSLADMKSEEIDWMGDATFFWWDEQNPIGDYWQYKEFLGGDVDPAYGYWYGTDKGIALARNIGANTRDSLIVWELDSLYSGWNMVANPYGWYVKLDTAAAARENIHFWRWDDKSSQYKPADMIGPYEAVWAKSAGKNTWKVSSSPVYDFDSASEVSPALKAKALRKDAARKASIGNWSVVATLKGENGKEDSWNVLGVGAKDEIMEKAPMGMGKFVRLAIADGKSKLAKSVKAVSDRYEWTLKVSASENCDGELLFDGVGALDQMGLDMYVTVDGKTQKVREGQGVKVALSKTSREVSVRVETAAKEIASKVSGFKVNRVGEGLRLGFDAPESLAGTTASYALTDVKGKVVLSGNLRVTGGTNSLDLKNPKSGMYFVQLKLGSQNVSSRILVK